MSTAGPTRGRACEVQKVLPRTCGRRNVEVQCSKPRRRHRDVWRFLPSLLYKPCKTLQFHLLMAKQPDGRDLL